MPLRALNEVELDGVGAEPDDELNGAIESEILPRLALLHRRADVQSCGDDRRPPSDAEARELAELAVDDDHAGMLAFVERLCRSGSSFDAVVLGLIPRAARLLGADWKIDRKSFVQVSQGLGSLQALVGAFRPNVESGGDKGLVVLVPAWGEQHLLALYLCANTLRRSGWAALVVPGLAPAELNELVAAQPVAAVGISVTDAQRVSRVGEMIDGVLQHSKNRNVRVILGGSAAGLERLADGYRIVVAADAFECLRVLETRAVG
ncbi:MAG: hypothetical protein JNK82_23970 [Myxococcaceae bacterium]|nr:hypothetical protein [Myxococcaceae bacterium]